MAQQPRLVGGHSPLKCIFRFKGGGGLQPGLGQGTHGSKLKGSVGRLFERDDGHDDSHDQIGRYVHDHFVSRRVAGTSGGGVGR